MDQKLRTKRGQGLGRKQEGSTEADPQCLHCRLQRNKENLKWHMSSGRWAEL